MWSVLSNIVIESGNTRSARERTGNTQGARSVQVAKRYIADVKKEKGEASSRER